MMFLDQKRFNLGVFVSIKCFLQDMQKERFYENKTNRENYFCFYKTYTSYIPKKMKPKRYRNVLKGVFVLFLYFVDE